ncbi:GAG-binding domain-containing protein, partial [Streptococcus ruminantium]|nr:GAG-binding domain-containing protein [Streptococcus ruminantium]
MKKERYFMTPQKKRHYSIRKLRAGVGSILIGTTLLFGLSTQLVQANTTADGTTSDSAEGTTAVPSVTNTTPATTATGGGTATTEENPKAEEPTEKPVEETAPKVEDKKEAETPNAPTNPADYPIVKELEKLLKEVEELPVLESTDYFKEQINFWNGQKELAKKRLDIAKKGENIEKVEDFLGDYVQYANIEKMARHAQQLYKKYSDPQMLENIKKAFGIGKDENTYASLEGSTLEGYVRDTVTTNYNKILELARKLDEEKAKKEKEKEKPAPEEPKKDEDTEKPADPKEPEVPKKDETPAPTPEPKKEEKPAPAPAPEEPKKEEEKPTPAPTPEEPKKEEEKPTPAPTPEPKKDEEKPAPTPEPKKDTEKPAPSQPKQDDSMKKDYKLFYQTKDKTEEVNFKGTPEELKATLDKAIEKYKQNGYPYVDRFERENRILLVFNQHKSIIVLETNGDGGSRQSRPFYGTPQELEAEIKKLTESLS